jgi:hypothetical protein
MPFENETAPLHVVRGRDGMSSDESLDPTGLPDRRDPSLTVPMVRASNRRGGAEPASQSR